MAARINAVTNPQPVLALTNWSGSAGTSGVGALTRTAHSGGTPVDYTGAPVPVSWRAVWTQTTASTTPASITVDNPTTGAVVAGARHRVSVYLRSSFVAAYVLKVDWRNVGGTTISVDTSPAWTVDTTANVNLYARLGYRFTAPAGAVRAIVTVAPASGATPLGATIAVSAVLLETIPSAPTRVQLVKNPNSVTTPIIQSSFGTGGVGTNTRVAAVGDGGTYAGQWTWSTAATGGASGHIWGGLESADDINVVAGTVVNAGISAKPSIARSLAQGGLQARIEFFTAAGAAVGTVSLGTATAFTAGQMQRLTVSGVTVPATATRARVGVHIPNHAGTTNGWTLQASAPYVSTVVGNYFDGNGPDTNLLEYAFTGAIAASTSEEAVAPTPLYFDGATPPAYWTGAAYASSAMIPVLTAVAALVGDPDHPPRKVQITVSGVAPNTPVSIIGQDQEGRRWVVRGSGTSTNSTQRIFGDVRAPLNGPVTYIVQNNTLGAVSNAITVDYPGRWVLTSLDGFTTIPFWWIDDGDPREQGIVIERYDIPDRRRPVLRMELGKDDTGEITLHTVEPHTTDLWNTIRESGLLILRTDGKVDDTPSTDIIAILRAPRKLARGWRPGDDGVLQNAREWRLSWVGADDPEPSTATAVATFADFNDVYAGKMFSDFNATWAGKTFADFNAFDWAREAATN